jgi:integrase
VASILKREGPVKANGRRSTYWVVRWRDAQHRQRSKNFDRQRDAALFAATLETDRAAGLEYDPTLGRQTTAWWADRWFDTLHDRKPKTVAGYRSRWASQVEPAFGARKVHAITRADVTEWVSGIAEHRSPSTAREAHGVLRAILRHAGDAGALRANPCEGVSLPRNRGSDMLFLDVPQLEELADTITPRYRALVLLGGYEGLRAGELAGLHRADIDLEGRRVTVRRTIAEVNGILHEGTPKTDRPRTVPLVPSVAPILAQHLEQYADDPWAFPSPEGGPLRWGNFMRRHFRPAVQRSPSVPDRLRFHDLRHTAASLLIRLGAHPREISEWLGHSTVTVSLDRYGHLFPSLADRLAEGLEAMRSEFGVRE